MTEIVAEAAPVVWRSMALPRPPRIGFADLTDAGLATRGGDGTYALSGAIETVMTAFDQRIRRTAVAEFGAAEHRYPALLPAAVLRRAGYFDAFPQLLMTAGHLRPDGTSADTGHCLSPTLCYHTYQRFADRALPAGGAVITACGKIFRHEGDRQHTLERLWDFTMREIVVLGPRAVVSAARDALVTSVCALVDELRLAGHLEVASDPFFAGTADGEAGARQAGVQRALKLKYELRLPVVDGRTSAVASFNLHGPKFGKAFGITTADGAPAYSGCFGIGLERVAYAFLCRHGLDPAAWPAF